MQERIVTFSKTEQVHLAQPADLNGGGRKTNNKEIIMPLQGLRVIACLGIFTSHLYLSHSYLGVWGVSIFIVLSGFLMFYSYNNKKIESSILDNLKFSINKIKRLYPLHIICMLFAIFIMEDKYDYYFGANTVITPIVALNVTLLQAWIPRNIFYFSLNGVAWYLSLSFFLYFLFPYLLTRIKKKKSNKNAILSIIFVYILQIVFAKISSYVRVPVIISDDFVKWFTYISPLFRLGDFYIGCNLGYLFANRNKAKEYNKIKASILEIITIMCVCLTVSISRFLGDSNGCWAAFSVLFIPTTVLLIYLLAINKGVCSGLLTNKLLVNFSNISTYFFLIHTIIINYYDYYFANYYLFNNVFIRTIICLSTSILLSVSWKRVYESGKKIKIS